jgi:hypothetical protein
VNILHKSSKLKKQRISTYYQSLCDDLIYTLGKGSVPGEDIFSYILQYHDDLWQAPPIETQFVEGRKYYGNFLKDVCKAIKWSIGGIEDSLRKWSEVADGVFYGKGRLEEGRSYVKLNRAFQLSPEDCSLIFSAPALDSLGTVQHKVLFACESAAFFAYVYDLPLYREGISYYTETPQGKIGVVDGTIHVRGMRLTEQVSRELLNISLNLPRGAVFSHKTRNTLDAIRSWINTEPTEDVEYILDVLAILRLGKAYEAQDYLNKRLLLLTPDSKLEAPAHKVVDTKLAREQRKTLSMEQRELDYIKVQDILNDSSRVDRVKLWDISEILVPKYMSQNTFAVSIGYLAGKNNTAAMFTKQRYEKMLKGWAKFRDHSLEKARQKLEIKFEDR